MFSAFMVTFLCLKVMNSSKSQLKELINQKSSFFVVAPKGGARLFNKVVMYGGVN